MRRYQLKLRCRECHSTYRRTVKVEDDQSVDDIDDPPCPKCSAPEKSIGFDPRGRAPAIIGSITARAIDTTNEMVAEDHKMTDMRVNPREGETSMPRLAPALQHQVDNFWGGKKRRGGLNTAALGQAALRGAFAPKAVRAPDVVQLSHDAKLRVPIHIVAGDRRDK